MADPRNLEDVYEKLVGLGLFGRTDSQERIALAGKLAEAGMVPDDLDALLARAAALAKDDPRGLLARWLQTGGWQTELATARRRSREFGDRAYAGPTYADEAQRIAANVYRAWCRLSGDGLAVDAVAAEFRCTPERLQELFLEHRAEIGTVTEDVIRMHCIRDQGARARALKKWLTKNKKTLVEAQ